ncbi:hypothetical protein TSUD_122460 [Trifolium subterraneum]|nr:hypothetical protein TSUD_122460 [Trifolium subterraneum]
MFGCIFCFGSQKGGKRIVYLHPGFLIIMGANLKNNGYSNYITANDLQTTYSGSPASSLISPISRNNGDCLSISFPEREFRPQWDSSLYPENGKYQRTGSGRVSGHHDTNDVTMSSQDTNFFCLATYAQFYLDQNPPFAHDGGRLSVSKDSDAQYTGGNGHQSRSSRSPKPRCGRNRTLPSILWFQCRCDYNH